MEVNVKIKKLSLEELTIRIFDYKNRKPNHSINSIGMFFETKKYLYFFDTGTGKVMKIDYNLQEFLIQLFRGQDVKTLKEFADKKDMNIVQILDFVETEDILKGTEGEQLCTDGLLEIAKNEMKSKCKQLILELTGACNLRCKYCIYSSSVKSFREFNAESMTKETIKKSIDYLKKHGDDEVFISFYGGEPLIRFDLMKYAIEYAVEQIVNKELHFGFTTNLTLMTKEIAEYLVRIPNLSIVCSVDGPEDIHDVSRVYANGNGTYKDVMKGLSILKEELDKVCNPSVTINFNAVYMVPYKEEKLNRIDENFKKLCRITEHSSYNITYPTSGTIPKELEEIIPRTGDTSMWDWMVNMTKECDSLEKLKDRGIVDSLITLHDRILTEKASTTIPMNACCTPGTRRLYIDTKGDMYVCERINKSPKIGNIHQGFDVETIIEKYYYEYSDKSIKHCSNCWAAKMCPFCYADRMTEDGISEEAHIHCEEVRLHLKKQFSFYHEILENNPEKLKILNDFVTK